MFYIKFNWMIGEIYMYGLAHCGECIEQCHAANTIIKFTTEIGVMPGKLQF